MENALRASETRADSAVEVSDLSTVVCSLGCAVCSLQFGNLSILKDRDKSERAHEKVLDDLISLQG